MGGPKACGKVLWGANGRVLKFLESEKGCRACVLLEGNSTGPEENSSRWLASRGCYRTPGCDCFASGLGL